MTAKELEAKIGFGRCSCIFIGEFRFEIYVDYNLNGGEKSYIFIHRDSNFDSVLEGFTFADGTPFGIKEKE